MNMNKNDLRELSIRGGKISTRFRNINILLFTIAFCIMSAVMSFAFSDVIKKLSADYAWNYATSSAETLNAHINKEIGLLSKASRSNAVMDWMADEGDERKKALAFEELTGIVGELYSFNLYVGLEGSLNEYRVEEGKPDFQPVNTLSRDNPDDLWYFGCIATDTDFLLSVGIDHVMQRKRVWLDYKVLEDGVPLGVICTGLEFSHVIGELFSRFDYSNMRGFIINKTGTIYMDSSLMDSEEFLYHEYEQPINNELFSPDALADLWSYLDGAGGYFSENGEPVVFKLSSGPYLNMTIEPVQYTDWSIVILSGTPSLYSMSLFLPISIAVLILLIAFSVATNAANYRLIFYPLHKLESSLAQLKENQKGVIYGTERDDELGDLSKTIQDLFSKANVDVLTGLYNRRFMENNFQHVMDYLARHNGLLSVIMLDVDYFKKYNDRYGHEQGDECLKAVAGALAGSITRAHDFTARYGGEEFVAVLPNTDEAGARLVAEKLIGNIRALNLPHADSAAASQVTVSVGVTTGKVIFKQKWEEYLSRADEALYQSKENGRNQYTYLHHSDNNE